MEFRICPNGHTVTINPWTQWGRVCRDAVKNGCPQCLWQAKKQSCENLTPHKHGG